ncbi:aldose epimerase family protein [Flavobacterium sp. KS-LB2]|uniref:aldose epimerase family protein n=1 Tax=Flavobacterium sp. KS-LB2 TaxID=3120525 RepID=UPI0030CE10DD
MESFGLMPDREEVSVCELSNKNGMQMKVMGYGATLTSLKVPLKNGDLVDVVLGFDTLETYMQSFNLESAPYMGATVGRFAGRINEGEFKLNGKLISLNKNNNGNSLHGGTVGFSQKNWKLKKYSEGKNPSVTFTCVSADGEEHFPGELSVDLTYMLSDENELIIEYIASTTEDTIVNLTHHSYFNLDGHQSSVANQEMRVNSQRILETTASGIPTGRFLNVANCPYDFTAARTCPSKIDTTFILNKENEYAASLFNSDKTLKMSVYTNQPAVHIYVGGNCFNAIKGKENASYHPTSGICFETQNFPDVPNHEHFPSSVLRKGELYYHKTIYKFQSF